MVPGGRFSAPVVSLSIVLVLVLSAAPTPADPGVETVECSKAVPCPIGPGTHEDTLHPFVKESAHYVITPPSDPTVIRIEVTGDTFIESYLRDPEGNIRAAGSTLWSDTIQAGAVAQPSGEWHLEVGYHFFASPVILGNTYTIRLEWEAYDHLARVDAPAGLARTVKAEFHEDDHARMDVVYRSPGWTNAWGDSYVLFDTFYLNATDGRRGRGGTSSLCCWPAQAQVETWGTLPDLPGLSLPRATPSFSLGTLGYDSRGHEARLAYGLSFSTGLDATTAWIAYNGTAPNVTFADDDRAFYHRLTDFDGDRSGTYVAGYTQAQNLSREQVVPGRETHHSQLLVNARTPPWLAMRPAQVLVERPDGTRTDVSGEWRPFRPSEIDDQEGTWRVEVDHIDGFEGDRLLFSGASFEIDREWIFGPRT